MTRGVRRCVYRLGRAARASRDDGGSAAVEFAIVAPLFITLVLVVIETALIFFAQQALQTAASQSARQIMTGQTQAQQMTAAQFKQAVCGRLTSMFNCANLSVNVQSFNSFSTIATQNPLQGGNFSGTTNFTPGVGGDIEVLQLFYPWPTVAAPLFNIANMNGGTFLLVATTAFRNEPF